MKVVGIDRYGAPLKEFEAPLPPAPGRGQVQVRMRVVSTNPVDRAIALGYGAPVLNRRNRFPFVLGRDGAGEVTAVGSGVTAIRVGQRVALAVSPRTAATYADLVNVPAHSVAALGDGISDELAACVAYAGLTAMQALAAAGITPTSARDRRICINGASGGFGAVAVQLAAQWGAEVTGVCSAANHAWVRALGARHTVDYRDENAMRAIHADVVINGAPPKQLEDMFRDPLLDALQDARGPAAYASVVTPTVGLITTRGLLRGLLAAGWLYFSRRVRCRRRGIRYRWVIFREDGDALRELMRFFESPSAQTVVRQTCARDGLPAAFFGAGTAGKTAIRW